jgi:hypothetical protein
MGYFVISLRFGPIISVMVVKENTWGAISSG